MLSIRQKGLKPKLKGLLVVVLVFYVMIGTSLYFLQEKLLFWPTVLAKDYQYQFSYPFEELFLKTTEHATVNALYFKAKNPKGVILYFHGNAGDLSRWGAIAEYFVGKDYDVLIMDYRTYGKSKGKLSEEALYHDAEFCYNYLKKQYDESDITLYGRSLGTGIAAYIASKYNPKQLILETPYYSMVDVAKKRFPIIPVKQLMTYELPTYKFLQSVNCPITMFHGTNDKVIPIESAKQLYHSASNKNIAFKIIEGGSHNNLSDFDNYHHVIDEVLD